ncbi:oligosaccharidyl-lipid flippase [Cryptococcus neoformans c45]|nr:oligosaccharidyl-lipid flippase [Cryptococcus neoformans var. grubii c45]
MTTPSSTSSASNPLLTARSLVLLQLLSRILTFTLNQSLLRLASPSVFGTAAIQFDLVCSSILFLSREGIRNALLRKSDVNNEVEPKSRAQIHALSIAPLQLGMVVSPLITGLYLWSSSQSTTSQQGFHLSLILYVASALIELSIEPCYIQVHRSSPPKINIRVQAEGGMAIVKAIITVASLVGLGEGRALISFALGQVAGAIWLAVLYIKEFDWDVKSLVAAQKVEGQPKFDPDTLSLAVANTGQSLIKHVLTEADRLAVARISPLDDQGGYAVAMNYGSLIARIVFQPFEESLLLYYSNSLSSAATLPLFTLTIRLSLYLSTIIRTFVPPLFPAVSPLLLPRQYRDTSAPSILNLYLTLYIPCLSLNGVAEAFHTASADPGQVKRQARWMIASSGMFAGILFLLTHLPPQYISTNGGPFQLLTPNREECLVLASCAAMIIRIVYALRHAKWCFSFRRSSLRWLSLLPSVKIMGWACLVRLVLGLLAASGRWERGWKEWAELVVVGGIMGLATLGFIAQAEIGHMKDLRRMMKAEKSE